MLTEGQYIFEGYNSQLENPKYYASVDKYSAKELSVISSMLSIDTKLYGYWLMDSSRNICGTSIFCKNRILSGYTVLLERPAKSLTPIKRIYTYQKREYIDLWKATFVNGNTYIIVKTLYKQAFVNFEEFFI